MSRSTAVSRERSRLSNGRRDSDLSELLRELSVLEESHRSLKRDGASLGRKLSRVETEKADLVAAHAAEKAAMAEENRRSRGSIAARERRIG